jgi:putative monooxygenase
MFVINAQDVKGIVTPPPHNRLLKVLLSPDTAGTSSLISLGMVLLPPGESGDPHFHETEQETWFVVSGNGKLKIGDEVAELRKDTVVVAPAGVEHQIINDGEEELKAIFIFSPSGPELQYTQEK